MDVNRNDVKQCSMCSSCCSSSDMDIYLTARDVFAISFEKQLTTRQFLESCCHVITSEGFPKVVLKKNLNSCIFNKNGECSLIRKPDMCAVPNSFGRWFNTKAEEVRIECKKAPGCILITQVTDLISLEKDPFFEKWTQAMSICGMFVNAKEKESKRIEASEITCKYLFEEYDINEQFYPQFDRNVLKVIAKISQN